MPSFVKEMKGKIDKILLSEKGNDDSLPVLNTALLNKLVSFSKIGKNIDDNDEIQDHFIGYKYYFDFKDLLENKNIWANSQNHRNILLQILSKIDNIRVKNKDKRDFENFIIEFFNTSKYDTEKAQLANIIYDNIDLKDDVFLKEIAKFCVSSDDDDRKRLLFSLKTNGFFSDRATNALYNETERKKKNIHSVIIDNVDQSFYDSVNKLFSLEENDNVEDLQLKKAKIYILIKAINSNKYKDSDIIDKKKIISDILAKSHDSFDRNLINSFACNCGFDAILFFDKKGKKNIFNIDIQDIINNLDDNIGEVKKQKINDIFENVSFDDIDFFELKGVDNNDDEHFYFKTSLDSEGKSKLLICFNSNQKNELLSAIYSHSIIYTKMANLNHKKSTCVDIFDFAKICLKVSSDPMGTNNYKDVYNKYYLHEEDKVLGGLDKDAKFSVKINSNENFVRNDYSDCIITTEILLEWLKLQAKSLKPLREMKVVVSDIENLPTMLQKYNDFVINQKEKSSKNLTLVDNLVIKNSNILSLSQIDDLINRLNDTKVCFESLKIDDKNIADYASYVESNEGVKNNYILYGENDNFFNAKNIEKQKHRKGISNKNNEDSNAFSEFRKRSDIRLSIDDLSNCETKVEVGQNVERFKDGLERLIEKKDDNNQNIDVNIAVDVDIDMDIEFMLNLEKEPPLIEDLDENDCITYDNIDDKMKELLDPKNNRFSDEMKVFLLFLKEQNKDSFKDIFQKITNRESLSSAYKEREFKNSNYRLTPEAFVHLLRDFFCFGTTKWNGSFGDPELSIFQMKDNNGAKKFVVAKTVKNINYNYVNPVEEMFTSIPTNTVGLNNSYLETKYSMHLANIQNNINALDNYITSSGFSTNIRNIFVLNPEDAGLEYKKYISDNKEEILNFLKILKSNNKYRKICSIVCSNFCKEQNICNINQKFSLINPINFLRGMKKVFDLLSDLRKNNFIDDNFIEQLPSILGENKYAIQILYVMLLKKKLDVERLIIAHRNNDLKTKISVDINDSKEVEKYFKNEKNTIGNYSNNREYNNIEKGFSNFSFNGILNYKNIVSLNGEKVFNYGNDVVDVDSILESGGVFFRRDLTTKKISCEFRFVNNKCENVKYSAKEDAELYSKYLELCYFLNKKRNRASDGTIEENQLTDQQIDIINNKVAILSSIDRMFKEDKKQHACILIFVCLNIINNRSFGVNVRDVIKFLNSNNEGTQEAVDLLYRNINVDRKLACFNILFFLKQNNDQIQEMQQKVFDLFRKVKDDPDVEGEKNEEYEKNFIIRLYLMYSSLKEDNGIDFDIDKYKNIKEIIKQYINEYGQHVDASILNIYNFYIKFELEDNVSAKNGYTKTDFKMKYLKFLLNNSDEIIEKIINKYYVNLSLRDAKIKEKTNDQMLLFAKYFISENNRGRYSVTIKNNKFKTIEDFEEYAEVFSKYLESFTKNEIFDVLDLAHKCSSAGLDVLQLLYDGVKNLDEKDNVKDVYVKIIAIQKLYLMAIESSKSLSPKDLPVFFNSLIFRYKSDNNNDNLEKLSLNCLNDDFNKDIPYIINFLTSDMIEFSHKINYLEDSYSIENDDFSCFIRNFSFLLCDIEENFNFVDKKTPIKFSKDTIKKILAKAYDDYVNIFNNKTEKEKEIKKVNNNINFVLHKILEIKNVYDTAVINNDKTKQSIILNLFGKILLSIDNFSIKNIAKLLEIIPSEKLAVDNDILSKYSYIAEHLNEYKDDDIKNVYKDVTKLYDVSNGEKYLNSGFTHAELMKICKQLEKQKNKNEDIINILKLKRIEIVKSIKDDIRKNNGNIFNDVVAKIDNLLFKIANNSANLIDNIYNKNKSSRDLLNNLNKKYVGELPIETLFRDESLALFDSEERDVAEDAKKTVRYLNDLTAIYINNPELVDEIISDYEEYVNSDKDIDFEKRMNFVVAFCVKHIKDQNKVLHHEQLIAVILRNIKLIEDTDDISEEKKKNRKFCLLPTGSGKTLTILFDLYLASIKKKTPFAITTNNLLVSEMIDTAEQNSLYRGHIFYLNEKQELIEKITNRKIPINEILSVLKNKKNVFFSSYKDFSFWYQKLLLNGGKFGIEIAKYLKKNCHVALDELDSIADAKTSNKISISSSSEQFTFDLANKVQKAYDACAADEDEPCEYLKDIFDSNFKDSGDYLKDVLEFFNVENIQQLSLNSKELLSKVIKACCTANKMKEGKEYVIDTNIKTGVSVYYPISNGEPNKTGAKYKTDIDLALKIKLNLHNGYFFDDIRKQTQVVSEASNFRIFDYVNSVFGVSGTIRGANEIWKQAGFTIDDIKPKNVKNIKYIDLETTTTKVTKEGEYTNCYLDLIFFLSALTNTGLDKEELYGLATEFLEDKNHNEGLKVDIESSSLEKVKEVFLKIYENSGRENDYFLTFMNDSNELESFSKRLKSNVNNFLTFLREEKDLIIKKPEIVILDKKSQLIDDYSVKQKLEKNSNCFVFSLPDRARGFNFPKSPKLIVTNVLDSQTNGQILGRTGRNGRRGTIIKAYTVNEGINTKDCIIPELMNQKSDNIINDFRHKKNYFDIVAEVSEKVSLFLNIITRNLDTEHSNEVYNNAYKVIGWFNEMIADKWSYIEKPAKSDNFDEDYYEQIKEFKNGVLNDLKESVFEAIYTKCAYFREGDNRTLQEIVIDLNSEYEEIFSVKEEEEKNLLDNSNTINDEFAKNEDKKYLETEDKEKEYKEKREKKLSSIQENEFITLKQGNGSMYNIGKKDVTKLSHSDKVFFTALGCLEMYGYDIKEYDVDGGLQQEFSEAHKISYNKGIIVGKKKILKNDHEELDIAIIKEDILSEDFVNSKLSTLSPDALLIIVSSEGLRIYQNKYLKKNGSFVDIQYNDSDVFEDSFCLSIDYLIRNFTEKKKIPFDKKEITQIVEKKYIDFYQKHINLIESSETIKEGFHEDYKNDLMFRSLSYIKNGILKSYENKSLNIEGSRQEGYIEKHLSSDIDFDNNYKNFTNDLNKFMDFNLDISDLENKNILDDHNTLLGILEKKIISILRSVEDLKKRIEECDELEYSQKLDLISKCNDVISKENLLSQIGRSMQVIALSACKQLSLDNFDKLDNILKNVNDIDEAEKKLKEITANNKVGDEFAENVNENTLGSENKLKESLYNEHNKIVNNINDAQNKIDRIKFYKQELRLVQDYKLSSIFEGFSSKESTIAMTEEFKNGFEKYNSFVEHIKNEKALDNRQKEQVINDFINGHVDNAISLLFSPDSINKIINEFTVNYDPKEKKYKLFDESEELENLLFNNIVDAYKKRFGEIIKNDGGSLVSMIKSLYSEEEDDFEDYDKRDEILKKYKDDIDGFKEDVKNILLSYQIEKNNNEKNIDNTSLPVTVYNVLGKMFEKLSDNYKMNFEAHKNVKNDIMNTIVSVLHFFKNVRGAHDGFKKDLVEILQTYIPNLEEVVGSNFQINSKTMSNLNDELNDLDIQTLKKIQKALSVAVSKDMSRLKNIARSKKIKATDVNTIVKFFIILCTLGLIFCTKKGRKMFKNKKIIGENIKLPSNIKPKEYFIKNSKEEKIINDNLSNTNINYDDVKIVDINNQDKEVNGKQVMNIVKDNLNTNKLIPERG